tara:strand:- start:225 stop:461 length:237 start_codon:yes stop_codon:yes gene_type:complete
MKSLFIRCSEETYELAHALAKKENRSLNKQIIHMIHSLADEKNVEPKEEPKEVQTTVKSPTSWGLTGIAETRKQDSFD